MHYPTSLLAMIRFLLMHDALLRRVPGRVVIVLFALMLCAGQALGESSKFRLTVRDDPASTVVIGWCQDSGEDAAVHYGPEDQGQDADAYPHTHEPDEHADYKGLKHRFARLSDLEPHTKYYFVVRDSDSVSERYWFRTGPDGRAPMHIVAGGDSRNNHDVRRDANRMVAKLRPDFIAFAGDMTVKGTEKQWEQWLEDWQLTVSDDGRMTPVIVARGNHEPSNEDLVNIFDVPHEDVYFALTFGDDYLRLYTLNTEISVSGDQAQWLREDLDDHDTVHWKMVQYHKPMWPHTSDKKEGDRIYDAWANLFYEHRVNLVIECDSHMVKSTWPIRPSGGPESELGFVRDDETGTVYIGEGCWGAPLRPADDSKAWTRDADSFNQVKWIRVTKDLITTRTIRVGNVDEVASVDDADPWQAPENLDIWSPSNGAEIYCVPLHAVVRQ